MVAGYINCLEDALIKAITLPNIVWGAQVGKTEGTSFELHSP